MSPISQSRPCAATGHLDPYFTEPSLGGRMMHHKWATFRRLILIVPEVVRLQTVSRLCASQVMRKVEVKCMNKVRNLSAASQSCRRLFGNPNNQAVYSRESDDGYVLCIDFSCRRMACAPCMNVLWQMLVVCWNSVIHTKVWHLCSDGVTQSNLPEVSHIKVGRFS